MPSQKLFSNIALSLHFVLMDIESICHFKQQLWFRHMPINLPALFNSNRLMEIQSKMNPICLKDKVQSIPLFRVSAIPDS